MKSKTILNILFVYFLILSLVLIIQLSSKKTNAIEPLPSQITAEDKLKNSIVMAIDSPVVIINEKQFLIDEEDSTLVPIIHDGKVYIPTEFLETAFGADINFSNQTNETTVRIDNKAIIFSNNGTSIKVIDNTNEEIINIEDKPKIIDDTFYISLRSFANIFDKDIFYNNDLIIISNIKDLFDPIQELDVLQELEKQVKQLPIVGNNDNLKNLLKHTNKDEDVKTDLLNIENLDTALQQQKPVIVKKTNNYNIYVTQGFIEVYFITENKKEILSFKVEKINNNIKDIQITDDRFILSYFDDKNKTTKTIIYDISNREHIKTLEIIEHNGNFYKNILEGNNLYTISKIDLSKEKNKLPYFSEYIYENDIFTTIKEQSFSLDEIFYFPDINDNCYTLISYLNLYDMDKPLINSVYLGMGNNMLINQDTIYVVTSNEDNNNLYQFKATLDSLEYIQRKTIKGHFIGLKLNTEKQLLNVILDKKEIYFDDNLIIR